MLRWTTRTRTRWLIVAGAAVGLVLLYVAFIFGTAVDGKMNVDARVHSTILTAFSDTIVSSVVLVGGAHLILRLARSVLAEFAAAKRQRECIEEKLDRILAGQSLAVVLKAPTGEFKRVNGTATVPGDYASRDRIAEVWDLTDKLNNHMRPVDGA